MAYQNIADQYQRNSLAQEAQALVEALNTEHASTNSCLLSNITQDIQTCLVDDCICPPPYQVVKLDIDLMLAGILLLLISQAINDLVDTI